MLIAIQEPESMPKAVRAGSMSTTVDTLDVSTAVDNREKGEGLSLAVKKTSFSILGGATRSRNDEKSHLQDKPDGREADCSRAGNRGRT